MPRILKLSKRLGIIQKGKDWNLKVFHGFFHVTCYTRQKELGDTLLILKETQNSICWTRLK